MRILMVAIGGGIGAALRYAVGGWVQELAGPRFPWGTLAVNLIGSFALAYLLALQLESAGGELWARHFWSIGVLGAFTTYSTFSYETVALVSVGDWTGAVANVAGNLVLGIGAAFLGLRLGAL